jgi:hypothetical protein
MSDSFNLTSEFMRSNEMHIPPLEVRALPNAVPAPKDVTDMRREWHSARRSEVWCVDVGQKTTMGISVDVAGAWGRFAFVSRMDGSVECEILWLLAKEMSADMDAGEWS